MNKIEKNDPRPITRPLLTQFEKRAAWVAAEVKADADQLGCRHRNIERGVSSFCGQCGALVSLPNALWGMVPTFGMAFTFQADPRRQRDR